jgi:hypothetical protein
MQLQLHYLLLSLVAEVIQAVPGHTGRDLMGSGDNPDCRNNGDGTWSYAGNTVDGRPYWTKYIEYKSFGFAIAGKDAFLYYDANCDGKTGASHSAKGWPQWIVSEVRPSTTKGFDLNSDGSCPGDRNDKEDSGAYSDAPNWDWIPPTGLNVQRKCYCAVWGNACPWHKLGPTTSALVGCPFPPPTYTFEWGEWSSSTLCGGEETRTEIERCADVSPNQDCPCAGRHDPVLTTQTRQQDVCTTVTTTTTTTTTTTSTSTTTTTVSTISTTTAITLPTVQPTTSTALRTGAPIASGSPAPASGSPAPTSFASLLSSLPPPFTSVPTIPTPVPENSAFEPPKQGSLGGGTIAVIVMSVLAVLGVGGVFLLCHRRKSRHPIPRPVADIPNPAFDVNMDDRARPGSVVVTSTADQIQYLVPMEQAPGEYLVPVARNQDYTYAPPMQLPASQATIDESVGTRNRKPSDNIGNKHRGAPPMLPPDSEDEDAEAEATADYHDNADMFGAVAALTNVPRHEMPADYRTPAPVFGDAAYALVASTHTCSQPAAAIGQTGTSRAGRTIGNTVYGAGSGRGAAESSVYASSVAGSASGTTCTSEYGMVAECCAIEAVYGDDSHASNAIGPSCAGSGIQRHSDARQGSVYTGFEGMDHDTEETDI